MLYTSPFLFSAHLPPTGHCMNYEGTIPVRGPPSPCSSELSLHFSFSKHSGIMAQGTSFILWFRKLLLSCGPGGLHLLVAQRPSLVFLLRGPLSTFGSGSLFGLWLGEAPSACGLPIGHRADGMIKNGRSLFSRAFENLQQGRRLVQRRSLTSADSQANVLDWRLVSNGTPAV